MYGVQSTLNHKLEKDGVKHDIEVGLRVHYDQIRRKQHNETYYSGFQREYYLSYRGSKR